MNLHIIIDFMHIYYKYFFQLREGKLRHLSAPINWKGAVIEKDTSLIYYPLRDIEGIRKNLEGLGHKVTMSICFDSPSHRTDEGVAGGNEYKAGRQHNLTEDDFENLAFIKDLLIQAGHNAYKIEGYEADDIVNYLVRKYKDDFDYTIIYTNDKDLLINIDNKVGVMRFKQYKGYTQVDLKNYESYLENEFGVFIPYNSLGLFLASAGDSADHIKGINKFGKVAFKKLITKVSAKYNINWSECGDYNKLAEVVNKCEEFLTPEQFIELKNSFVLVANLEILEDVSAPTNVSTKELREQTYMPYKMISLVP
jgi:5'-3' exonuclease